MAVKSINCPNCGHATVPGNQDIVECSYCKSSVTVSKQINIKQTVDVEQLFHLGSEALDVCDYQKAYDYATKILEYDAKEAEAWRLKGMAAAYLSTLANNRTIEVIQAFENAVIHAPEGYSEKIIKMADFLNAFAMEAFRILKINIDDINQYDGSSIVFLVNCQNIAKALNLATTFNPDDLSIFKNIVKVHNFAIPRGGEKWQEELRQVKECSQLTHEDVDKCESCNLPITIPLKHPSQFKSVMTMPASKQKLQAVNAFIKPKRPFQLKVPPSMPSSKQKSQAVNKTEEKNAEQKTNNKSTNHWYEYNLDPIIHNLVQVFVGLFVALLAFLAIYGGIMKLVENSPKPPTTDRKALVIPDDDSPRTMKLVENSPTIDEVKRLIVNTEVVTERIASLRDTKLKIYNQYTRTENGVTIFYYDFKIVTDYTGGVGRGTIVIEKAGNYWKSRIDGWSNY